MSPRIPSVPALLGALAITLAGGCGEPVERESWLELAGALPLAEVRTVEGGGAVRQDARNGVRALGEDLFLPLDAQIDFFLRPPAGSVLEARSVRLRGLDRGWIEVSVRIEGEGESRQVGRLEGTSARSLELPSDGERAIRLRLSARSTSSQAPSQPGIEGAGLLLGRPAVTAPDAREGRTGTAASRSLSGGKRPAEPAWGSRGTGARANVLIYMIDTLRADHLGCYGYGRPVSPAIDRFARDAVLFEDTVAQSPWTRSSVASLLTGLWPGTHGAEDRWDTLAPEALTLAEVLHRHGYRTGGVITNRSVARAFGFAQGFDTYRMLTPEDTSARVHELAVEWLSRWREEQTEGGRRPFFLYLHTVDPHSPYDPPERFRERFAAAVPRDGTGQREWLRLLKDGELEVTETLTRHLVDLFDGEIAANDESFGRLTEWLAGEGLLEETVVVLVSDHGEEFHEHGQWEHGKTLYAESVQVPLIVRFPGPDVPHLRGRRVAVPVQHTDVFPTLLAYLGLPVPGAVEGRDLGPLLTDGVGAWADEALIFSRVDLDGCRAGSVTTGTWRLHDGRSPCSGEGVELYHRRRDPGEQRSLAERRPVTNGYLRSLLRARELLNEGALQPGEAEVDEETREQLRALGYLN